MTSKSLDATYLRQQIVGVDSTFETPFGERLMSYCDYTASGRCLKFVESYLQSLQRIYANTHTEDDITGRSMSQLLHEAEESIKNSVNAGPNGRIIAAGTGATGAIDKLQQLIGVALPPATRKNICDMLATTRPMNRQRQCQPLTTPWARSSADNTARCSGSASARSASRLAGSSRPSRPGSRPIRLPVAPDPAVRRRSG